jgi:hypothetical protein
MKKFLAKASKTFVLPKSLNPGAPAFVPNSPGLQKKYLVPPVPHPSPHTHLAILVTPEGLLIRPHVPGPQPSTTYILIPWGKTPNIQELPGDGNANWDDSVIVYGIVGILELFSGEFTAQMS